MPGLFERVRRLFAAAPPPPPRLPEDPRLGQTPWLGQLFAQLGERYQPGADEARGMRVLRRTGRARFNPMPVWVRASERLVLGEVEVRGGGDREAAAAQARALLDQRITPALAAVGLAQAAESLEDWAGTVLTRRYEGRCDDASRAATAVKLLCESEQQFDLRAES